MKNIRKLKSRLEKINPIHDTPIGLIHPYWARKPLNIVQAIIQTLTVSGDTVADPFVGSGTIAFAALASGRDASVSDLNPLACLLTEVSVLLTEDPARKIKMLTEFFEYLSQISLNWFILPNGLIMERQRFDVTGDYVGGKFKLSPVEIVAKAKNGKWFSGRHLFTKKASDWRPKSPAIYRNSPVDFKKIELIPNSRIAIPKGARLSHYFTTENICFINLALSEIPNFARTPNEERILTALISSSFPLLRLSDRKASSQWPYWRPKTQLTSRNPIFVLKQRLEAFLLAADWAKKQLTSNRKSKLLLKNCAVQDLFRSGIRRGSAQLVLTDPPYSDQAPYIEYSSMWNSVLKLGSTESLVSKEIVKTDAPTRKADTSDYETRLKKGFTVCCELVKPGGYLAFFYQDRNLENWKMIARTLAENQMTVKEVIPLPKQRRSMKTVTTPGKTLDGDLLVVAERQLSVSLRAPASVLTEKHQKSSKERLLNRLVRDSDLVDHAMLVRECFLSTKESINFI